MVVDDVVDMTVTNAVVDETLNATVSQRPPRPCPLPCPSMTLQQWELYGELLPITSPNNNPNPFAVSPEHPDTILFRSSPPPPDDDVTPLQPNEASINSGSSSPKAKSMPIPQPSGSVHDADDALVVSDALLLQPKSWKP